MLGPELETFKGNKMVIALAALLAMFAAWVVYLAFINSPPDNASKILSLLFLAAPVFYVFWLQSIRISFHKDSLSYHTLLGEKEFRWDSLERFYYAATRRSIHFIPVGTYYHFKLVDSEGKKLTFGNQVENPAQVGQRLIEKTYPALFRKASDQFKNGQDLDFGAIKVSRLTGIKVKKLFGYKTITWDEVSSHAIQKGRFYIWRKGEKRTRGPGIRQVPNTFALDGLLTSLSKPPA